MSKTSIINNFKKIASVIIGIPAALVVCAEVEDLRFVWVRFAAVAVLGLVLYVNTRNAERRA